MLVHLLSPGTSSYDLVKRQHSLEKAPPVLERNFDDLRIPPGAGRLILGGNLSDALDGNPVLARFVNLSGGQNARIVVIAAGYPSDSSAQLAADRYAASLLGAHSQTLLVSKDAAQPVTLPENITGILLIGGDQSLIQANLLEPVKATWLSGMPVMTDEAASAIIGAYYSAHGPTPEDIEEAEGATQKSFIQGTTNIIPGLGFINAMIEPRVLGNNRWGRLFSLAYKSPQLLAIGSNDDSALEITQEGATVLGDNVLFVLDLRTAKLDIGSNKGFVIANGLLDVFSPNEIVRPIIADSNAAPIHMATPALPTISASPTATPTQITLSTATPTLLQPTTATTQRKIPTRTLRPTSTSPAIPPAADPTRSNWMILVTFAVAIVVLLGVGLNWRQLK